MSVSIATGLSACAAGPDYVVPRPPTVAAYLPAQPQRTVEGAEPAENAQFFVHGRELPRGWWHWFGSEPLVDLVERGFANSPTLAAARARLRGAEATLRARRALRSPEIVTTGGASYGSGGGGGGGGGGQAPPDDGGGDPGTDPGQAPDPGGQPGGDDQQDGIGTGVQRRLGGEAFAVYTATATIRYDFDLVGRNRRLTEAAAAEVENQRQQVQAAYLALAGNIVATAMDSAALRAQIAAREELIAGQDRRLQLLRIQVEEGYLARADLVTSLAQVAALRAELPTLRAQLATSDQALAQLIGVPAVDASIPRIELAGLRLPPTVPIALPSRLVRTRPDVLASEALLRVASANIGVEEADLYPDLTLDGSFGIGGIGSAFDAFFNVGGNLLAPVFDGGRRRAERDVALAAYEEALANYRAQVLTAFTEVANGIRALEGDAGALAERRVALDAAAESLSLADFRRREGAIGIVEVLVIQQQLQDARFAYIAALAQRMQDTAALFAALGPGPLDDAGLQSITVPEHLAATRASLTAGRVPDEGEAR